MRLTVRAGEVREGDRLIVPDDNGGEREIVVRPGYPTPTAFEAAYYVILAGASVNHVPIVRHPDELVVVERPDSPITITEALGVIAAWGCENFTSGVGSCFRNGRTINVPTGTADSACAPCIADRAIVAARAGDTR